MRVAICAVTFLAAGIVGAVAAVVATFFGMLYGLRFVAWLFHDDQLMLLMCSGVGIGPLAGILGFGAAGTGSASYVYRFLGRRKRDRPGFKVGPVRDG